MQKRLVRKLEPHVLNYLKGRRINAAILIQRCFRRYRHRSAQVQKLRLRNEHRRQLALEEELFLADFDRKASAAKVI